MQNQENIAPVRNNVTKLLKKMLNLVKTSDFTSECFTKIRPTIHANQGGLFANKRRSIIIMYFKMVDHLWQYLVDG